MKPATKLVSYNSTVAAFIQFATNQTRRFPFAYCTYNISLNICVYVHVHLYIHASFWTPQSRHFSRNWKALRTLPKATPSTVRLPSPFVFLREAKPNEGNFHDLWFVQNKTVRKKNLHLFFGASANMEVPKVRQSCIIWCQVTAAALRLWKSKQSGVSAWYEIRCWWRAFPLLFVEKTLWNCKTMVVWNLKVVEFWSFQKSMAFDFKKVFPRFVCSSGWFPGTKGDGCPQQS